MKVATFGLMVSLAAANMAEEDFSLQEWEDIDARGLQEVDGEAKSGGWMTSWKSRMNKAWKWGKKNAKKSQQWGKQKWSRGKKWANKKWNKKGGKGKGKGGKRAKMMKQMMSLSPAEFDEKLNAMKAKVMKANESKCARQNKHGVSMCTDNFKFKEEDCTEFIVPAYEKKCNDMGKCKVNQRFGKMRCNYQMRQMTNNIWAQTKPNPPKRLGLDVGATCGGMVKDLSGCVYDMQKNFSEATKDFDLPSDEEIKKVAMQKFKEDFSKKAGEMKEKMQAKWEANSDKREERKDKIKEELYAMKDEYDDDDEDY